MMRKSTCFFAVLGGCIYPKGSSAQTSYNLGLGVVAPSGNFGDVAGGGIGLSLGLLRQINGKINLIADLGTIAYGEFELFDVKAQWYGIPIKGGVQYYPTSRGFFITTNAGLLSKIATVKFTGGEDSEKEIGVVVSLGVGVDIGKISLTSEYNLGNEEWAWFGAKAICNFGE